MKRKKRKTKGTPRKGLSDAQLIKKYERGGLVLDMKKALKAPRKSFK